MENPKDLLVMCQSNYDYWKKKALESKDKNELKKALEKAFFWLETQTSLVVLWSLEHFNNQNEEFKKRIMKARANLSKKLLEYARSLLEEMKD